MQLTDCYNSKNQTGLLNSMDLQMEFQDSGLVSISSLLKKISKITEIKEEVIIWEIQVGNTQKMIGLRIVLNL